MSRPTSRRQLLAGAPLLACALSGCTYAGFAQQAIEQEDALYTPTDLKGSTYRGVDLMYDQLRLDHRRVWRERARTPTVVASIADIRDVNHSTPFGNIIADLVRTRLAQLGVPVIDMRLRSSVAMSPAQGELVLSRNRHDLYPAPIAGIICTGTYAVARVSVFVSLKMIRATDREILAAADFRLPRTFDVRRLLLGALPTPSGNSSG